MSDPYSTPPLRPINNTQLLQRVENELSRQRQQLIISELGRNSNTDPGRGGDERHIQFGAQANNPASPNHVFSNIFRQALNSEASPEMTTAMFPPLLLPHLQFQLRPLVLAFGQVFIREDSFITPEDNYDDLLRSNNGPE
ncbi:hypothetical protein [Pseudochelatococcus sp. G4_1912]|uniref:hypothetical protein n=1 Tax=Pseudochelatococcus sp. G4_1912 TaxID=3114288 RepID=UPI0039C6CDD8